MELNFKKVNISLVFKSKVVRAGTSIKWWVVIEHTCEVFVQLYNMLDEKVGASVIADLSPNYFLTRDKLKIHRLTSHKIIIQWALNVADILT